LFPLRRESSVSKKFVAAALASLREFPMAFSPPPFADEFSSAASLPSLDGAEKLDAAGKLAKRKVLADIFPPLCAEERLAKEKFAEALSLFPLRRESLVNKQFPPAPSPPPLSAARKLAEEKFWANLSPPLCAGERLAREKFSVGLSLFPLRRESL